MSPPRIEIVDPSPEGQRIAEAFRARGFYVVERSIDAVLRDGSDAAVLLIAGEVPGCADAIARLRSTSRDADFAVLVLGDPVSSRSTSSGVLSLGADALYARPVAIDRLARKVETLLTPRETRLRSPSVESQLPEGIQRPERTMELEPERSGEASLPDWRPPERTMELPSDDASPAAALTASRAPSPEPVSRSSVAPPARSSFPPSGSYAPPASQVGSKAPSRPLADALAPRLLRLIHEADRRVFPGAAPLELRFAVSTAKANEIVPDELLDAVSMPIDPVEDDPLDAFTYLGPMPDHTSMPSLPDGAKPPWVSLPLGMQDPGTDEASLTSAEPGTFSGRRKDVAEVAPQAPFAAIELGEQVSEVRRGTLRAGEVVRLLVDAARSEISAMLELGAGALRVRMELDRGVPRSFSGPIYGIACRLLVAERRLSPLRELTEEEARATLERAVESGILERFTVDRAVREARETLLFTLIGRSDVSFEMEKTATRSGGVTPFGRTLEALALEGSRRAFDPESALTHLGAGVVALAPDFASRAERASLEPELAELIVRAEGVQVNKLLGMAPLALGLPGVLVYLLHARAITVRPAPDAAGKVDFERARSEVLRAAALAESGDYFAVLGVETSIAGRELEARYEARRRLLESLRFGPVPESDALEQARRTSLEVLAEAFELLRDDRLREAYRASL